MISSRFSRSGSKCQVRVSVYELIAEYLCLVSVSKSACFCTDALAACNLSFPVDISIWEDEPESEDNLLLCTSDVDAKSLTVKYGTLNKIIMFLSSEQPKGACLSWLAAACVDRGDRPSNSLDVSRNIPFVLLSGNAAEQVD